MFDKFVVALLCAFFGLFSSAALAAEVVDRSEYTTTREVAPGELKTTVSPQPLNFQTASGEWKPVDLGLEPAGGGAVSPGAVDGDLRIPETISTPVTVEHDGREVSIRLKGASGEADVDDATAVFDDALPGVEVQYEATPRGLKERLVLQSASAPVVFAYDVRAGAAWSAVVDDNGHVVLRDGAGVERYRITAPLAWDSAEDPAFTNDLRLSVSKVSDGRWTVTLRPSLEWLRDSAREFPVTLDPDFSWSNGTTTFNGATDTYLASGDQANSVFSAASYLQTGHYNRVYKSLLRFDVAAAIPTNAVVSGATFKAYAPPATPKSLASHSLRTVTAEWDANANWNRRKVGVSWTTLGGDVSSSSSYTSAATNVQTNPGWYSWTAPLATIQGWVDGSLSNYGFQLTTDASAPSNNAYVWASTEASTSSSFPADSTKRPILEVSWSVPDTTAPALTLSGELSSNQTNWRTMATGDITLGATDAGTGVKRLEILEGSTVIQSDTQSCPAGGCSQNHTFTLDLDALGEGIHTLTAAAVDGGNLRTEQTFTVRVDRQIPALALSGTLVDDQALPAQTGTRAVHVAATDAGSGIVDLQLKVDGVQQEHVTQTCTGGGCSRTEDWSVDVGALGDGNHTVEIIATDGAGRTKSEELTVTKEAYPMPEAPPLSDTSITPFPQQVDFLYDGPEAVQTGLEEEALQQHRTAVVTGKVFNGEGVPAAGVTVSVIDHPEFGETVSRENGQFFLVVNGGATLRIHFEVQGALPADREVETKWNDYVWTDDVYLVGHDPVGTPVDFGTSVTAPQLAESSTITDQDGTRTARVYVRPGTQAWKLKTDGSTEALTAGTVRVSEYTVGTAGPERMPAALPDATAYTWAAEFQIDQASAADDEHVRFSKPVVTYLDNFAELPIGDIVPVGTYEWDEGEWLGDADGRVIKIIGESDGKAIVDVTGFGAASSQEKLEFQIDDDELEMLADTYGVGDELWRVEMASFSTKDLNKPIRKKKRPKRPKKPTNPDKSPQCKYPGSIIGCQSQTLGEVADLGGTPYSLRYESSRTPAAIANRSIRVPMTFDTVDDDLWAVETEVVIAGQKLSYRLDDPEPNATHTFRWDGKDGFGRKMVGGATASVTVNDKYIEPYSSSVLLPAGVNDDDYYWVVPPFYDGEQTVSWGFVGDMAGSLEGILTNRNPSEGPIPGRNLECNEDETRCWYALDPETDLRPFPSGRETTQILSQYSVPVPYTDARSMGIGGWAVSAQHRYDTGTGTLFTGDGQERSVEAIPQVVETVRDVNGTDNPTDLAQTGGTDIAVLPDGSILRAERGRRRILKDDRNGHTTVFAGSESAPIGTGDGGPALEAGFGAPANLAVGPDGSVFVADATDHVVRKITPDGIIRRVAGNGSATPVGDGRSGPEAAIWGVSDIAVAPDGTLYIGSEGGLHRLDPSGTMTMVAGLPWTGCMATGNPCQAVSGAARDIAVAPDGTVFWTGVSTTVYRLYRYRPGEDSVTEIGWSSLAGDDTQEGTFEQSNVVPTALEVDAQGNLWMVDSTHGPHTVWRLEPDNRVTHIGLAKESDCYLIQPPTYRYRGEGGPFKQACGLTAAIARGPDGMYLVEGSGSSVQVRRVRPALTRYPAGEILVPAEDGAEAYRFDNAGRHIATLDGRTERVMRTFAYDSVGRLTGVTETDFGTTSIVYDSGGDATVTAPEGQETHISIDADGWASEMTDAAGAEQRYEYAGDGGLMTRYENQLGDDAVFEWSATGRLLSDTSFGGTVQTLARSEGYLSSTVVHRVAGRVRNQYDSERGDGDRTTSTRVAADGTKTVSSRNGPSNERVTTSPDGMETRQSVTGSDPRWGANASTASTAVRTPAGLSKVSRVNTSVQRSTGADANDPFAFDSVTTESSVNGRNTTSTYDAAARTDTETTPMGRVWTAEHDSDGRVVRQSVAGRSDTTFEYDLRGRRTVTRHGDAESTTVYGSNGLPSTEVDALGRTTAFGYDAAGRVTSKLRPGGLLSLWRYDSAGALASETGPDGRKVTYVRDADGNQTGATRTARTGSGDPALVYAREYDDEGRLIKRTRPSGEEVSSTYDSAGNLVARSASDGTSTSRTYEAVNSGQGGRVAHVDAGTGASTSFEYDGSLTTGSRTTDDAWPGLTTGPQPNVAVAHDDDFRASSETIAGQAVSMSYNADAQPVQVGDVHLTYDVASGDLTQSAAAGTTTTYETDGRGRLAGTSSAAGATPIFGETVTRDELGRITARTETAGAGAPVTFWYSYDAAGRMNQVTEGGVASQTFDYDASGGLVSRGNGTLSTWIATDGHGRPTETADGTSLSWTADGELTSVATVGANPVEFDYDGFGRLDEVTLSDGRIGRYRYDGLGRRTAVQLDGNLVRRYVYGTAKFPRARLDAAGDVLERYVYATQTHVPDLILRRDGQRLRLLTDALGSVRAVVDVDSGDVVQRLSYDAYGRVSQDTAPGTQPFGFKGALADPVAAGAGLIWMGERAYLPSVARFITVDPEGLESGWNQHDAFRGDPINMVDVSGRTATPVTGVAVGAAAAAALAGATYATAQVLKQNEDALQQALDNLAAMCSGNDDPAENPEAGDGDGDLDDVDVEAIAQHAWDKHKTELQKAGILTKEALEAKIRELLDKDNNYESKDLPGYGREAVYDSDKGIIVIVEPQTGGTVISPGTETVPKSPEKVWDNLT